MQEQTSQQGAPQCPKRGEIWRGFGTAFLLHMIQIPLAAVTGLTALIFIGVSQVLYIVPAVIIYYRNGRYDVVKGLVIAAALTFLLNATCTAIFLAILAYGNSH
ncbi:MAG: hypothetical protein J2P21_19915 [Chloracidobacterium sp.]|nr:hypothetical protein [Chloracidobacterium sp.]